MWEQLCHAGRLVRAWGRSCQDGRARGGFCRNGFCVGGWWLDWESGGISEVRGGVVLGKDAVDTGAVEKGVVVGVGIAEFVVVLARLRSRRV